MSGVKAVILAAGKGKRMGSDLPKVLHPVRGKPLVQHCVEQVRAAGIDDIIVVVGHRREDVQAVLGDAVQYAVQEQQLGTGHAVAQARPYLQDHQGSVLVMYGDMPLLRAGTLRKVIDAREQAQAAATLLTMVLENPPDFGRILRTEDGAVADIVEVRDATPEQLRIREVNVGLYGFDCQPLLYALDRIRNENRQQEYYLTDTVKVLVQSGHQVTTVSAGRLEEVLGINDPQHLDFAEKLPFIEYAESLYDLIDAVAAMATPQAEERDET